MALAEEVKYVQFLSYITLYAVWKFYFFITCVMLSQWINHHREEKFLSSTIRIHHRSYFQRITFDRLGETC
jgi:hypothetical protein